ncbi:MAG: EAL domain-containing protein [Sphingomonas sp.]|nr:MAG: EAL domain-containing protein [Sphingomonas sp.]
MPIFFNLHFQHSGFLVAVAVGICLTAGWSVSLLAIDLTDAAEDERTRWRNCALALAAGLGVWTTHFIAILAYRPDLLLRYDPVTTVLSAIVGVVAVGLPMVAITQVVTRTSRCIAAAMAGAGIWCMHAVGITGMLDCAHFFSRVTNMGGLLLGASVLAAWQLNDRWSRSRPAGALLFALAVCTTHFVSLAGDVVIASIAERPGGIMSQGLVAACIALAVSATCLGSLLTFTRVKAAREHEARALRAVLESMTDGLVFIDNGGRLRHFNRRFLDLFDTPAEAIEPGLTIDDFLDAIARFRGWTAEKHALVGGAMKQWVTVDTGFDRECEMEDGRTYHMQCRPVARQGIVLTFTDISAERTALGNLKHLAYHDSLTGLGNRRALREQKEARIELGFPFSLLLIDLDEFKRINDAFGHGVGDKLLVHIATELIALLPSESVIARMGGDEIAILACETGDAAIALADSIVVRLSAPVVIEGRRLLPSCSIGISGFAGDLTPEDLMKRADMALYEAKRLGRRRAQPYVPGLAERPFQPVVQLSTGMTTGYEALIRWDHPTRGWIPPAIFIPIAEDCGLIEEIGRWVIMEACRQLSGWSPHLTVAINVSAAQLKSEALVHHLTQAILVHGVMADRVEIEITETALIDDADRTAATIDRIRRIGVKVALDDFGTGQSSLSHLRDFQFDRIKIDRSFVVRAGFDPRSMAVLRGIVGVGKELGVLTHAEGVETKDQLDLLRMIGCDAVQGYLVGRPVVPGSDQIAHFERVLQTAISHRERRGGHDVSAQTRRFAA